MKKFLFSASLVLAGTALWWGLSNTARFSIKKWDAKFNSVLESSLTRLGVSNNDLLSSVNEIKNDAEGQYVLHHMTLKKVSPAKIKDLTTSLEESGATVRTVHEGKQIHLMVQRGARLYQDIVLLPK